METTEEHAMYDEFNYDYDPWREDELAEAREEALREKWEATATECGNCGELWQAGEHRATRIDPGYYEQPTCPACGEWSIGDDVPERDDDGAPSGTDTQWITDLFAEQFPADPAEERPF